MKVCHTEAMKLIKELEKQKDELIEFEDRNSTVSYKEGETPIDSGYAYETTREQIRAIDDRIRAVRTALGRAKPRSLPNPSASPSARRSCSLPSFRTSARR